MSDLDWFRLFSGEVPVDDLDLDTWPEQKRMKEGATWVNDQAKWFIISYFILTKLPFYIYNWYSLVGTV